MDQLVYKIFRPEEWDAFEAAGRFDGSEADRRDGFIHLSKAEQLAGTIARHYAGEARLAIAAFPANAYAERLQWEKSRGGELFPHLYSPLFMAQLHSVEWTASKARD